MQCFTDIKAAKQLTTTTDPSVAVDIKLAEKDFAATTVGRLFQKAVARFPNHPALRYKTASSWEELTYSQYYNKCLEAARAYIEVSWKFCCDIIW